MMERMGGAVCRNVLDCHRPVQPGDPVFQRRLWLNRKAAAYWMPRSSRGMTAEF